MYITLFVHAIQCTNDAVIKYGWSTQPNKQIYKLHPQIYLENLIVHRFFSCMSFSNCINYPPFDVLCPLDFLYLLKQSIHIQNPKLPFIMRKLWLEKTCSYYRYGLITVHYRQDKQSSDICPHKVNEYRSS